MQAKVGLHAFYHGFSLPSPWISEITCLLLGLGVVSGERSEPVGGVLGGLPPK
jgi:hypothetical protein